MQPLLDQLVSLLDIEEIEENIFRGRSPKEGRTRVFGGQVAAQAFVAAERTVPETRPIHSLHCYFLRPGDVAVPIVYFVDRIRDGRSFTTRRVVAIQHGEAIFNLSASFHQAEPGLEHQQPMPEVPAPERLPTFDERFRQRFGDEVADRILTGRPIDIRWCEPPPQGASGELAKSRIWMRADGKLPPDPRLHTAVLIYASDFTLTESVMRPHRVHWTQSGVMSASLDHCMWFHRPKIEADDWWLYVQDSPAAGGARGLARGTIYTRDGTLVCSVAQEVLLRTPQALR